MGRKIKDITGKKFGRLTVISLSDKSTINRKLWVCACDCGTIKTIAGRHLVGGATKSCGCLVAESTGIRSRTHGKTKTPEYKIWLGMKQRCSNPKNEFFYIYGGRGITVCKRWINSFENFFADMGSRPEGMSIDRIDCNGPYSPENCRWASDKQQNNNTRKNKFITHNGETLSYAQWSERLGGGESLVQCRIFSGWDKIRAVTEPVNMRRRKTW